MALLGKVKGASIVGLGMVILSVCLILSQIESSQYMAWVDFTNGFCTGISIPLILIGAAKIRKEKNKE